MNYCDECGIAVGDNLYHLCGHCLDVGCARMTEQARNAVRMLEVHPTPWMNFREQNFQIGVNMILDHQAWFGDKPTAYDPPPFRMTRGLLMAGEGAV